MGDLIPLETAREVKRLKDIIHSLSNSIKTLNRKVFENYSKMTPEKMESVNKLKEKFSQDIAVATIELNKLTDKIKPRKIESMYQHFIKLLEPHFPGCTIETKAQKGDFYSFSIGGRDVNNNRFGAHVGSNRDHENQNLYKLHIIIGKEVNKEGLSDKKEVNVDLSAQSFPEFAEKLATTIKSMLEGLTGA